MARKPNVDLGIGGLFGTEKVERTNKNMEDPIKVGTYQYGSYKLDDAKRRMKGDPCVPPRYRNVVGRSGNDD